MLNDMKGRAMVGEKKNWKRDQVRVFFVLVLVLCQSVQLKRENF